MAKALENQSNQLDGKATKLDSQAAAAFGARIRNRAAELSLSASDVSRLAGIKKQSMGGYWTGERLCGSDRLFALSDALRVNARWLVSGEGPRTGGADLVDAAEADFVNLPRYDLGGLTEAGKANRVETIPFRKDWLSRRLLTSSGLWITEMPSDYDALGLSEGDVVICSDIGGAGPQERWACIFRGSAGPFVARYSNRPPGELAAAAEALGDVFVTAADLAAGDTVAIARVHARLLAKL